MKVEAIVTESKDEKIIVTGHYQAVKPCTYKSPSKNALYLSKRIKAKIIDCLSCVSTHGVVNVDARIIDDIISSSFYSGSRSRFYFLNRFDSAVTFNIKDAMKHIFSTFGSPINNKEIKNYINVNSTDESSSKKMRGALSAHTNIIRDYIMLYNQRDSFSMSVDMFAKRSRIELLDESARIIFKHAPFKSDFSLIDERIVNDFKAHFPQLDNFIEMIVAARFASDRKKAYLWLHCDSDWGKGFLLSCLSDIGATVDLSVTEIEKIFSGAPVGRSMADFKRAIVLSIDEFKNVKSELKQLQNSITLSPKNQLSVKVDIYTKLFTSAESVSSLANGEMGIEDQFANRFSLIRGNGALDNRDAFKTFGNFVYFESIKNYVAKYLNELIKCYVAMGKESATRFSDAVLVGFHQEYAIEKTYQRFSDSLPNLARDMSEYFANEAKAAANFDTHTPEIANKVVIHDGVYYLKSAGKAIGEYLKSHFDGSQLGSLNKKKSELYTLMSSDNRGVASHRIEGKFSKAIRLN